MGIKTYTVTGLVMTQRTLYESDQYVDVFTQEYGKLTVIGRHAKKSKTRQLPDTCTEASFVLYQGKTLPTVVSSHVVSDFLGIRQQFDRIAMAMHIVGIVRDVLPLNHPHIGLYQLVRGCLTKLSQMEAIEQVKALFYKRFLQAEGLYCDAYPLTDRAFQLAFEAYSGKRYVAPLRLHSDCVMMEV